MLEKVLVCLDGSPLAEEILPYIAGDGRCFGKVILLKVLAPPGVTLPLAVPGETVGTVRTGATLSKFQKDMDEAPAYLEQKAQPLREKGLDVECVVLEGSASQAIIDFARDNEVGLIAIATHGYTGLRHITMGSTAEYLLKHAGLPVLMVTPWKH
ncbi:MAG: universal stress protein [Dehalococcoidales bacterium]|jgi:nucleotide-binding universal stress UspA family protein